MHRRLIEWTTERAQSDFECGVLLLAAARARVHRTMGFATAVQYGAAVTGMTERQVRERLRVAVALEQLPLVQAAFRGGRLVFSKVRELTRVATMDTEAQWVLEAEPLTSAAVQELCSGRTAGDVPSSPARDEARRYRLEFENVDADVKALLAEARRVLTEESGEALDDSQFLRALTQQVLRADANPERSNYQVALSECPTCKTVRQRAGGKPVVVSSAVAARAGCDSESIGNVDAPTPARATQSIPPAVRRAVMARHGGCCAVPGCRLSAFVDVHHVKPRSEGGTHDPELLVPLCSNHHDLTHRGRLLIGGTFSAGFVFRRANGVKKTRRLGRDLRPAGLLGQAFEVLRGLGFRAATAQALLDAIRTEVDATASLEQVLHLALRAAPTGGCSPRYTPPQNPRSRVADVLSIYEAARAGRRIGVRGVKLR